MKLFFFMIFAFVSSQSFARETFYGTDNFGKKCSLTLMKGFQPVYDLETRLNIVKGKVITNFNSKAEEVSQQIRFDMDNNRFVLTPELIWSFGDEYQIERVIVKVNAALDPVSFTYYNNKGIRFFKPIHVKCDLK